MATGSDRSTVAKAAPGQTARPGSATLRQLRFFSYLMPCLVLGLALSLSWYQWDRERREIELVLQSEFDTRVRETVSLFRERMLAYEQALRATHGLFSANDKVQRGDFQAFVANLRIQNHPGLQGMGFAMLVSERERAQHIAAVRSQGFPAYTVQPAADGKASTSAVYFEPTGSSFLSTLGTDYFAEPSRRPAMQAARDSGNIAVSNKVRLPEEDVSDVQAGYRMYLPVYKNGRPHGSTAERQAHIVGWIYAAFSMDGLMDNILGERPNISVEVYDGGETQGADQLIDTYSDRVGGESAVKLFYTTQQVEVGGYGWTLTAHSLPNFTTAIAISKLQWVARLGAAASVMAALLTWLLLRRRMRALRTADSLRIAKDNAEAASRAKTQFLAAASHDLRQPIQALSLFVATLEAIARRPGLTGAEVGHVATKLQLALNNLGRLLNGMFDLSRLDSGTVSVVRRPVPVADLLRDIHNAFAGPAQAKGLALKVVMPHQLWVDTDPVVLSRVLSNLVSNALRYTEQGRILVGCRRRAGHVEIQVFDTGIGISAAEQQKIFSEFYQVPDVARERERGMGLGLSIVQRSVQLLGGEIRVRSTPGKGSVFTLILPRAAVQASAPLPAAAGAHALDVMDGVDTVLARDRRAVLVIDNDPEVRESMQRLLQVWGYHALVAANVDEACKAARQNRESLALVLSDFSLDDGITGIDVIDAVQRDINLEVPAIIITGDTSAEPIEQAASRGYKLVYKPIAPEVLANLLESIE